MELKKVKKGTTVKSEYYGDKTLGSFTVVKGLTKEQKKEAVIIETVPTFLPTLVKGNNNVGV